MRRHLALALAAAAQLGVAGLAPMAGASAAAAKPAPAGPTASAPAPAPVSPLVAASRAAKAARAADAGTRKVWTLEDLENLERSRPGGVNVVALPTPASLTSMTAPLPGSQAASGVPAQRPGGVAARYEEILAQADAEIAKLERERLAGLNPYLRGLAAETPRPAPLVEADLAKWRERRAVAAQHAGATGADGPR